MLRSGVSVVAKIRGNKQRFPMTPQTATLARLTANATRSTLGTPPPVPVPPATSLVHEDGNSLHNLLPLPPRDKSKPQPVLKHHERKHPLVLPSTFTAEISVEQYNIEKPRNEPIMSTFKPHLPVLKQVSCPEPPASYVNSLFQKTSHENGGLLSPRKTAPVPPPKPARSLLLDEVLEAHSQSGIDSVDHISNNMKDLNVIKGDTVEIKGSKSEPQSKNHHVSCEDLLDFATDKPATKTAVGTEKNINSDEVRVMQKVLANEVQLSPDECVDILYQTGWDVHKAIKCIRLRETLKTHSIYLTCNWAEMLGKFNWNIRQASNYLIATQGLPEDTTEV